MQGLDVPGLESRGAGEKERELGPWLPDPYWEGQSSLATQTGGRGQRTMWRMNPEVPRTEDAQPGAQTQVPWCAGGRALRFFKAWLFSL